MTDYVDLPIELAFIQKALVPTRPRGEIGLSEAADGSMSNFVAKVTLNDADFARLESLRVASGGKIRFKNRNGHTWKGALQPLAVLSSGSEGRLVRVVVVPDWSDAFQRATISGQVNT